MHGTTESYNLGHAASHGCVRLRPGNASILYSLVRRQGMQKTKVVVMNGPLPPAPGAVPMADAQADEQFAAAEGESEDFAAKARSDSDAADDDAATVRPARAVVYRVSVGSDERKILRECAAWLRSLDRKYGITR